MNGFLFHRLRIAALVVFSLTTLPCFGWVANEEQMAQETISRADSLLHHLPTRLNRSIRKMEQSRKMPPRQRVDLVNGLLQQAHRKVDVFTSLQRTLEELLIHSDNLRVRTRGNIERLSVRMSSYRRVALEKIDELESELMRTENEVQRTVRGELEESLDEYQSRKARGEDLCDYLDSPIDELAPEEYYSSRYEARGRASRGSSSYALSGDRSVESSGRRREERAGNRGPRQRKRPVYGQGRNDSPRSADSSYRLSESWDPFSRFSSSGASIVKAVSDELSRDIRWMLHKILGGFGWLRDTSTKIVGGSWRFIDNLRIWYVRKPVEKTIKIENESNPYREGQPVKERHLVRAWALYKVSALWVRTCNDIKNLTHEARFIVYTMFQDIGTFVRASVAMVGNVWHTTQSTAETLKECALYVPRTAFKGICAVPGVAHRTGSVIVENTLCVTKVVSNRVRSDVAGVSDLLTRGASCLKTAALRVTRGIVSACRKVYTAIKSVCVALATRVKSFPQKLFKKKALSEAPVKQVVAPKPAPKPVVASGPSRTEIFKKKVTQSVNRTVATMQRAGACVKDTALAAAGTAAVASSSVMHGVVGIGKTAITGIKRGVHQVITCIDKATYTGVWALRRFARWCVNSVRRATGMTVQVVATTTKKVCSGCRSVVEKTAETSVQGGRHIKRFTQTFSDGVVRLSERAVGMARTMVYAGAALVKRTVIFSVNLMQRMVRAVAAGAQRFVGLAKSSVKRVSSAGGNVAKQAAAGTVTACGVVKKGAHSVVKNTRSLCGATYRGIASATKTAVNSAAAVGESTIKQARNVCSSTYRGVTKIMSAVSTGAVGTTRTAGQQSILLVQRTKALIGRLYAFILNTSKAALFGVISSAKKITAVFVRIAVSLSKKITALCQRMRDAVGYGAQASVTSVRAMGSSLSHCAIVAGHAVVDSSRRLGSAVVHSMQTVGQTTVNTSRAAARATRSCCSSVATHSTQVIGQFNATVRTNWDGVCAGAQKITAGAQHMGSTVKGGAQKVVESAGCGVRAVYKKVTQSSLSSYTWLKATGLAALTTVSDWSNRVKESFVAILHRVRMVVGGFYQEAKNRFQQWWAPKYIVPAAVSTDEVQKAAQEYNVQSQHVSIADPESVASVTPPTPLRQAQSLLSHPRLSGIQNRIVGLFVGSWQWLKERWHTIYVSLQNITGNLLGSVRSAGDTIKNVATSCYRTGKKVVVGGASAAQKGVKSSTMWFGGAVDSTRDFMMEGAYAAANKASKVVRGGVAAGKRSWHTVKNAVWKQKERLPWTDSTHRGVKTTLPTRMAPHRTASSATPLRPI